MGSRKGVLTDYGARFNDWVMVLLVAQLSEEALDLVRRRPRPWDMLAAAASPEVDVVPGVVPKAHAGFHQGLDRIELPTLQPCRSSTRV